MIGHRLRLAAAFVAVLGLTGGALTLASPAESTTGITRSLVNLSIPLGHILKPINPPFYSMSPNNSAGDMFVGTTLASGRRTIVNKNQKNQPDKHATMSTDRSLPLGSISYCAFDWRYAKSSDLVQSGWNLFFQTQITGSPVNAIETQYGNVIFVYRDPTTRHKLTIGPIPWGHRMFFVAGLKIASSGGFVNLWYGVDAMPDVTKPPLFSVTGINTNQGGTGHNTMGQYAEHLSSAVYVGDWSMFGRDVTAAGAIAAALR